jgi:hypothetical protein
LETKARYGRGGFLGFGRSGQLRLTDEALEWRSKAVDDLAPADIKIPLQSIQKVSREGYIVRFPLWAWFIGTPGALIGTLIASVGSIFIKRCLEVKTSEKKFPFGLVGSGVKATDEWVTAINERRRVRIETG